MVDCRSSRADLVVDVGANDGYFTFGCAAAMRNSGRPVRVLSFEPLAEHVEQLRRARLRAGFSNDEIAIESTRVGAIANHDQVALNSYEAYRLTSKSPLIKIDVEGAEIDVLTGASKWLRANTMIVIEVHRFEYLHEIELLLLLSSAPLNKLTKDLCRSWDAKLVMLLTGGSFRACGPKLARIASISLEQHSELSFCGSIFT